MSNTKLKKNGNVILLAVGIFVAVAIVAVLIVATTSLFNHGGPDLNPTKIQDNAIYLSSITQGKTKRETMPDKVNIGDAYVYGDYIYTYGVVTDYSDGWHVALVTNDDDGYLKEYLQENFELVLADVLQDAKLVSISETSYGPILESINGVPVTDMTNTFSCCTNLTESPVIPERVSNMTKTFIGCSNLANAPAIPDSVVNMQGTFKGCTNLAEAPIIPSSVEDMSSTFSGCANLIQAPVIPSGVKYMNSTFNGCTSLTKAPTIPDGITDLTQTFMACSGLTEPPVIPGGVTVMATTFYGCSKLTKAPVIPWGVTDISYAFSYCVGLTKAPVIPSGVDNMEGSFKGCTWLTGEIEINANPTYYEQCLQLVDMSNVTLTGSSNMLSAIGATGDNYASE